LLADASQLFQPLTLLVDKILCLRLGCSYGRLAAVEILLVFELFALFACEQVYFAL